MTKEKNKKINPKIQRVAIKIKSKNPNLTTMQIAEKVLEIVNVDSFYSISTIYNYCKPGNIEYYNKMVQEQHKHSEIKKHVRESNQDDLFAHLLQKYETLEKKIAELEVSLYEKKMLVFRF